MKYIFYIVLISCLFVSCSSKYTVGAARKPRSRVYNIKPTKIVDVNDLELGTDPIENLFDGEKAYLAPLSVEEPSIRKQNFKETFNLKVLYFDYDDYNVKKEYIEDIKQNALWLKKHPEYKILIEGHTDQRGTTEYNLALAQQRASSVRAYLAYLDVDPKRIATISYGEEKLVSNEATEEGYAKNRRVEFLLFKSE